MFTFFVFCSLSNFVILLFKHLLSRLKHILLVRIKANMCFISVTDLGHSSLLSESARPGCAGERTYDSPDGATVPWK